MEPQAPPPPADAGHPIQLVVEDDLHRSRLTVFFRLLLAIPHYIWLFLWSIAATIAAIINWFATLITGRSPQSFHDFLGAYVRYWVHLHAYLYLAANPYPGFTGSPGNYPIDVEIQPRERQSRWKTGFRIILALPALLLAGFLAGTVFGGGGNRSDENFGTRDVVAAAGPDVGLVAFVVAFLAWFAILVRGRAPSGFRDLLAAMLRYSAQVSGYLLLLTDRYPNSDIYEPRAAPPDRPLAVRMVLDDDLRRSRLTVLFRLLLAFPHFVWILLWTVAAYLAVIANWFASLAIGHSPNALHRFLAAYLRYQAHLYAFVGLAANPFPGFVGARGYPLDLEIDPPADQPRLVTLFRIVLGVPAYLLLYALTLALYAVAFLGWFASLVLGRMPPGLRNLAAYVIHYQAQFNAYFYILTARYPYSGPVTGMEAGEEPVPALETWPPAASESA
jgi:hypothetical protein